MTLEFILLIIIAVIIALIILTILIYNDLISAKHQVNNAWKQIDVQLKRRFDLVPNLVETVKGYAKHEKTVFQSVTKARTEVMKATNPGKRAEAENFLAGTLKSLFAVAENYPKLVASQNFLQLQSELSDLEAKIAYSRQFYNDAVMLFNRKLELFPSNIIAGLMKLTSREYFSTTQEIERKAPKVSF